MGKQIYLPALDQNNNLRTDVPITWTENSRFIFTTAPQSGNSLSVIHTALISNDMNTNCVFPILKHTERQRSRNKMIIKCVGW